MKDVYVTITRETAPLTQAGFGLPLIVDSGGVVAYAECETLAEVAAAGFASGTDVYAMAAAIFAQSPRPERVAVVGVVGAVSQAVVTVVGASTASFSVAATAAGAYDGAVGNGITVVITSSGSSLTATWNSSARTITVNLGGATRTAAAIAGAVNALVGFDSAAVQAGDFTVAGDVGKSGVLAGGTGGVPAELDVLIDSHNDWYFLLCVDRDAEDIAELSAWAAANEKLHVACPEEDVAGTAALAEALVSDRTALIYHDDPGETPDAAWVGKCSPSDPGSITWKFKTLSGITAADVTSSDVAALHAAHANTYVSKYGVNQTSEGKATSGEYIDVIRCQDWLAARITEAVEALLIASPKVPYDNRGIAQVVDALESVLQAATARNVVARDDDGYGRWTVTAPDRDDIPAADRANRNLPDVRFTAILAGAVHEVRIVGVLEI